ncbi:MAG: hypothetical protein KF764_25355 [Labilithrix sp.]|nr:hypothetical protein [Labilithrix sp.]MBX3222996.1 hypothetical protein [Labilithrix sp.]
MRARSTLILAMALGALSMAALNGGCGSSDTSGAMPASDDAGADSPVGESLTVLVVTDEGTTTTTVPNAAVIFDYPGGERLETRAGADGLVTIPGIDWSKGTAAATVFGSETQVVSFVELTKAEIARASQVYAPKMPGDPKRDITLFAAPDPKKIKVSGNLSRGQGELVVMSSTIGGSTFQGPPGDYSLDTLPNAPFALVAGELTMAASPTVSARGRELVFHRWSKTDVPATAGDLPLDVDLELGTPLVPSKAKGRIVLPGGAAGPLGGSSTLGASVSSLESAGDAFFGTPTRMDVTADGSAFDFDFEFVKVDGVMPTTRYFVQMQDQSGSFATVLDWPTEGVVVDGLLAPPVVAEASRSLGEPFAIDGVAPEDVARVIFLNASGKARWQLVVPRGVKIFTPPRLEGDVKAAVGSLKSGVVFAASRHDSASDLYLRFAVSRPFAVK